MIASRPLFNDNTKIFDDVTIAPRGPSGLQRLRMIIRPRFRLSAEHRFSSR